MDQRPGVQKVTVEQGFALTGDWEALLAGAKEIGAYVTPWVAEGDRRKETMPADLSQADFIRIAGDDPDQQRFATEAWMAALLQRGRERLRFTPGTSSGG